MSWLTNMQAVATAIANGALAAPQTVVAEAASLFNGMSTQVNANMTTILTNYTDPAVVTDQVTKTKEIANLPPGVSALLSALPAAASAATTNPATGMQGLLALIAGIKAQV